MNFLSVREGMKKRQKLQEMIALSASLQSINIIWQKCAKNWNS